MTQERPHSLCRSLQAREQASCLCAWLFIYLFVYLVILLSPLQGFLFKCELHIMSDPEESRRQSWWEVPWRTGEIVALS